MKDNKFLISIVIPVYNVEKYIKECVESFRDNDGSAQIILVDDGSTDTSKKICDELAKKKNIEVWHKKNGGLASARNYGLEKAKGKYVAFVDSDDRIDHVHFIKVLDYLKKNDSDVFFMNITKFYPDNHMEDMGENIEKKALRGKKLEIIKYLSTRRKFPASACGKIYRREFLEKNNLKFPDDNRISEDLGFAFDVIRLANSYDKIEMPYYLYRQKRDGSITNTVSEKSFDGVAMFVSEYTDEYVNSIEKNESNKYLLSFVAYEYAILLWLYSFVHKNKEQRKNMLTKYKPVMNYGNSQRLKIIKILVNILGIDLVSKMLCHARGGKE